MFKTSILRKMGNTQRAIGRIEDGSSVIVVRQHVVATTNSQRCNHLELSQWVVVRDSEGKIDHIT